MSNGMSKREKSLVAVALTLLIGVGYYAAVYQPLSDQLQVKRQEKRDEDLKYKKALDDINSLEDNKANLKQLFGQASIKSKKFYPEIIQEKLILDLEAMFKSSGLTVKSISWMDSKTQPVERFVEEVESSTGITLNKAAEEFKGNSQNTTTQNKTELKGATSDSAACETTSCTINVQSSYDSVKKFIQAIEASGRNISITNTVLSPINTDATLTGSITLEFYGLPKVDDSDDGYSNWSFNNDATYGKDQLFTKGAATGAFSDSSADETSEASDFIAVLKSTNSELPMVSLGKADDDSFASYLYGNNEKSKDVVVELTEEGNKLKYTIMVGNKKYPSNSNSGKEFTPKGKDIVISIQSEERVGASDNGEIKLKVVNNTSKTVNVNIIGDDKSDPRVPSPESEGSGTVNWINK